MRRELVAGLSVLASLAVHAAFVAFLHGSLPVASASVPRERSAEQVLVGAEGDADARSSGRVRSHEIPVELGGPASAQNVDRPTPGGGGDGRSSEDAMLLAMNVDDVRLQDAPWNAVGVSQVQRIDTASSRASWDNRRATPNPHDQPFLATGAGQHRERRPPSILEPNRGAPVAPARTREGSVDAPASSATMLGARTPHAAFATSESSRPSSAGAEQASPGSGIAQGTGVRESRAAPVATGRPPVDEGPAATLAQERDRPRDDTSAELLATQLVQTWVDASPRSGPRDAPGRGGAGGGGAPGSGHGAQEGGQALAHSPGAGGRGALDTRDGRYQSWLLSQRRRVYGAMVFPRERRLAMDQGVVVYAFMVDRTGQLVGTPRLARSSGFADFDAAALRAIRATLPTAPPPSALMEGRSEIPVRLHLDFSNPMVR
ncbi:MAG: energy transducer TonB [Sandaracinaceae bacterium]|nr:energy transducer TonB [Sandaracinaceae bacterium]